MIYELGDRKPDVGEERAGDDVHSLAGDELVGDAHRIAGARAVVTRNHLELLAEHAALGVDVLDRELPASLIGLEERRLRLVAIELADLDCVLREGRRAETNGARCGEAKKPGSVAHAVLHFVRFASRALIRLWTSSEPARKLVKVA